MPNYARQFTKYADNLNRIIVLVPLSKNAFVLLEWLLLIATQCFGEIHYHVHLHINRKEPTKNNCYSNVLCIILI